MTVQAAELPFGAPDVATWTYPRSVTWWRDDIETQGYAVVWGTVRGNHALRAQLRGDLVAGLCEWPDNARWDPPGGPDLAWPGIMAPVDIRPRPEYL